MRITRRLAAGAVTAAALLGVGGGVVYAQTSTPTSTTTPPTSPAPAAVAPTTPTTESTAPEAAEPTTPEPAGTEAAQPSDGPGGHADGPGDVQHEGGANEQ
jgi:hypothetical protein